MLIDDSTIHTTNDYMIVIRRRHQMTVLKLDSLKTKVLGARE